MKNQLKVEYFVLKIEDSSVVTTNATLLKTLALFRHRRKAFMEEFNGS